MPCPSITTFYKVMIDEKLSLRLSAPLCGVRHVVWRMAEVRHAKWRTKQSHPFLITRKRAGKLLEITAPACRGGCRKTTIFHRSRACDELSRIAFRLVQVLDGATFRLELNVERKPLLQKIDNLKKVGAQ